jgi:hypothetical protein
VSPFAGGVSPAIALAEGANAATAITSAAPLPIRPRKRRDASRAALRAEGVLVVRDMRVSSQLGGRSGLASIGTTKVDAIGRNPEVQTGSAITPIRGAVDDARANAVSPIDVHVT